MNDRDLEFIHMRRSSKYLDLMDESYFQLVPTHNLIFCGHEFRKVPCAVEVSTSKPISLFRREVYNGVGT